MGSHGALAQARPTINSSAVITKSPSIGRTTPLEKRDSASPCILPQILPGRVLSSLTLVRTLLRSYKEPSPLTPLKGGPGGSGVEFLVGEGKILSNMTGGYYDIVSWDPRGVGYTTRVSPIFATHITYTDPSI